MRRAIGARLVRRWQALPPRTIRLRLTVVYGTLFIICGAALLAITYGLDSNQLTPAFINVNSRSGGGRAAGGASFSRAGTRPTAAFGSSGSAAGEAIPPSPLLPGLVVGATGATGAAGDFFAIKADQSRVLSTAVRGALLLQSGIALAIMAFIAIWLGWVVAGRALRPLRAITAAAQEISANNLHRRLALDGPTDELRELGDTFDALLERLERAFSAQRQFAANVSHELRTPLTYERTLLEVALADPDADVETLRAACEQVLATGAQQERLIEALLMLSRGQRGLEQRETVELAEVAAQALARLDTGDLVVETSLESAAATGDPRLIERLVANLVANAVQYNQPGGALALATRTEGPRALLSVANSGEVVPAGELERLFEPFQRLGGSRTAGAIGLGLGLSIVRAIAEAHGATIAAQPAPGGGLTVQVSFPRARARRAPGAPALPGRV